LIPNEYKIKAQALDTKERQA